MPSSFIQLKKTLWNAPTWFKFKFIFRLVQGSYPYLVCDGLELVEADLFSLPGFTLLKLLSDAGDDMEAILQSKGNLKI